MALKSNGLRRKGQYVQRIQNYMEKAIHEAKMHTSWLNPNAAHDKAISQYVKQILNDQQTFLPSFSTFAQKINALGMLNSLSQTLIKLTSVGVPDLYQGSEIWDFSLVDPDNRRSINFKQRQDLLKSLDASQLHDYWNSHKTGALNYILLNASLNCAANFPNFFGKVSYIPLCLQGEQEFRLIAYARVHGERVCICLAGRFFVGLEGSFKESLRAELCKNTYIELPLELTGRVFKNIFTLKEMHVAEKISVTELFEQMPFAVFLKT